MRSAPALREAAARVGPWLSVLLALIAGVALGVAVTVTPMVRIPPLDPLRAPLGELTTGAPREWVMAAAWRVAAAAYGGLALLLLRINRQARVVLALVAVAMLLASWQPWAVYAVLVLLALWPLSTLRREGVAASLALGIGCLALVVDRPEWHGIAQRAILAGGLLWVTVVAVVDWLRSGRRAPRSARVVLRTAVVLGTAWWAGTAATVLAPTVVETDHYRATVTLRTDPMAVNSVRARTAVGDITLDFRGIAPGLEVQPSIKPSITDVFSTPTPDLGALTPDERQIDEAVREAATRLGLRFALGALVGGLLGAALVLPRAHEGLQGRWRRARVQARRLAPGALAGVAATGLFATSAVTTYRTERFAQYRAEGVLGLVQQNRDILSSVETRATQVTPYLQNLLALSAALRDRYVPTQDEAEPAVRVLVVSDIHGANQYPLVKSIVESEGIDLVIDAGDIANLGYAQELDSAGIPAGIQSIGVPYLFVRGNHDATSATDTAVLTRLQRVPNVVLLQPPTGRYAAATVDGLTVAGFNDPRWFGDTGGDVRTQEQAQQRFSSAWGDREPFDIVVGHEPTSVRGLDNGLLLINGHMHSVAREGNRLQAGTFTGGGPLAHYIASTDGAELAGQPAAFDILDYGSACRLQRVTRYTFHGVLEGRPAFDDVSLIRGSSVAQPPAAGRACGEGGLSVTLSQQADPDQGGQDGDRDGAQDGDQGQGDPSGAAEPNSAAPSG